MGNRNSSAPPSPGLDSSISEIVAYQEHTHFTVAEIRLIRAQFREVADEDGLLTREDFEQVLSSIDCADFSNDEHHFEERAALMNSLFDVFDAEGKGRVSLKQFIVSMSVCARGTMLERIGFAFRLFDRDHDHLISRQEMVDVLSLLSRSVGFVAPELEMEDMDIPTFVAQAFEDANVPEGEGMDEETFSLAVQQHPSLVSFERQVSMDIASTQRPLHYLVAVDGSEAALRAFDHVHNVMKGSPHRLTVLTVIPPLSVLASGDHAFSCPDNEEREARYERYCALLRATVQDLAARVQGNECQGMCIEGPEGSYDLAHLIVAFATKHEVDIIFLGNEHNGHIGHIAGQIARDAQCSVYMVR